MPRKLALEVLERVEQDQAYSHIALATALDQSRLDERDRALVTELVYGTLTWQRPIDAVLSRFVSRGLDTLDPPVRLSLRMAVYQLLYLDRIPAHAIVNEAVNLARQARGKGAAGFVNGVLRNMLRQRDRLVAWSEADRDRAPARYLGLRYSLPDWLATRLLDEHGLERAEALADAFTRRPRPYLRALVDDVELAGLTPVEGVPGAYAAEGFDPAVREAIAAHRVTVQDLGSQLIGWYAGATPGQRVVDACAGLGGKTLHLARQVGPAGRVVAVEPNASKLELLARAARGSALDATIEAQRQSLQRFTARASDRANGTDPFDLVVVDAPCTGLGVMRRHPETRWRRDEADIAELVTVQRELLEAAASLVRPGGQLVYSVCSFTHEEGPDQAAAFLARHPEFTRAGAPSSDVGAADARAHVDWSRFTDAAGDLRLNPLDHDCDAFYAARFTRTEG